MPAQRENQKLIKQYPFIADIVQIISAQMGLSDNSDLVIDIKEQEADEDLMSRRAGNIGIDDERLFALNYKGQILNYLNFPHNEQELKMRGEVCADSVFWTGPKKLRQHDMLLSHSIYDEVKYLIWVTVQARHTVRLTVYNKPNEGFRKLQKKADQS